MSKEMLDSELMQTCILKLVSWVLEEKKYVLNFIISTIEKS